MDNIQFNRKCRQEIQWRYILNAIRIANPDAIFVSHKEMLKYIINEFHWDSNVELTATAFAEWLKQEKVCIAIPHGRNTIVEVGRAWGYCKTENSTEQFISTWYERIANKFIQMCNKLNLEL